MANIYYIQYYFEGPEKEIRHLGRELPRVATNPLYGCGEVMGKIRDDSYRRLGDGQLSLYFELASEWGPATESWDEITKELAPHSRYYYYAEELATEGAITNDIGRKYFPWDFVTLANFKGPVPEGIRDFLTRPEKFWKVCPYCDDLAYTRWTRAELRQALLKLLPHPEWDTDQLVYIVRDELQRFEKEGNMWLYFRSVKRCPDGAPELYDQEDVKKLDERSN